MIMPALRKVTLDLILGTLWLRRLGSKVLLIHRACVTRAFLLSITTEWEFKHNIIGIQNGIQNIK